MPLPRPHQKGQHLSGLATPVAPLQGPLLYPHFQLRFFSPKKLTLPATPFPQEGREWLAGPDKVPQDSAAQPQTCACAPRLAVLGADLAQGWHDLVSHVWGPGQSI